MGSRGSTATIAVIMLVCVVAVAAASERPGGRQLASLGDGRFLLARETDEGVILQFCGDKATSDDPVVLLRDYAYVKESRGSMLSSWRWSLQAKVRPLPRSSRTLEMGSNYGITLQEEALLLRAQLITLPGDLDELGYIPNNTGWGDPRPIALPKELDFPRRRRAGYYQNSLVGPSTHLVEWRLDNGSLEVTLRNILARDPIWSVDYQDVSPGCEMRDYGGAVGTRCAWLTWQCRFDPFPMISIDLETGAELARRTLDGYAAAAFPEPNGNRLLVWLQDFYHDGKMMVLDGVTLSVTDSLAVPYGWNPVGFKVEQQRASAGDVSLATLRGCWPSRVTPPPEDTPIPRSLVIKWDERVSTYFLPEAACFDGSANVRIWREWYSDGSWRHIEIAKWEPPRNETTR